MSYTKNICLVLLVVSLIPACTFAAPHGSSAQKDRESGSTTNVTAGSREEKTRVTLTKENDGAEYRFQTGQIFQVVLPENSTTGYQWTIAEPAPPNITLLRKDYAAQHHEPPLAGAGGTRIMTFQATGKGSAYLVLLLRRPWEAAGEHVDSFNLRLHIE